MSRWKVAFALFVLAVGGLWFVSSLAVGVVHWLTAHGGGHGFAGFGGAVSLSRGWWGRRTPSRNRPCSR